MSTRDPSQIRASRERFVKHLLYEPTDYPPYHETLGFWPHALERWESEGLPAGMSGEEYFDMDGYSWPPGMTSATQLPLYPLFEEEVLEDLPDYLIVRTPGGVVEKRYKHGRSMPQFMEFPIKDRKGWDDIKWRLDAGVPERYAELEKAADDTNARRNVPTNREIVPFAVCGAYGFPRDLFGEESLAYLYYDDPELIHEILQTWLEFYCEFASKLVQIIDYDYVFLWEDMAFKNGPLISPAMVEEFMMPYYRDLIAHLKGLGFRLFSLDTDGDARLILKLFVDAGVNSFGPCEIAAGVEPVPLRREYGRRISLEGGIDKRELAKGREAIHEEVMRKVPTLLEHGGYAPGVDHAVPSDVSFENYCYFVELVRKLGREITPDLSSDI